MKKKLVMTALLVSSLFSVNTFADEPPPKNEDGSTRVICFDLGGGQWYCMLPKDAT